MASPEPRTTRTLLLLAAALMTIGGRSRMRAGVRLHVERLQRITPIQQFAPMAGNRALFDREGHGLLGIRIVAQRDPHSGRLLLVPVDERVLAGWLG